MSKERFVKKVTALLAAVTIAAASFGAPSAAISAHAAAEAQATENGDSLFRGSDTGYYYTVLTEEEKGAYRAIVTIFRRPDSTEYSEEFCVRNNPDEVSVYPNAIDAVRLDHPEFFWYFCGDYDLSTQYNWRQDSASGKYYVRYRMKEPFPEYKELMKRFNRSVDDFLADIDMNQSDYDVALQIHDKLIDLTHYDYDMREFGDLGRTAYAPLIENSDGEDHMAVCVGYAMAYSYLMRLCGLECVPVTGIAGPADGDISEHTWNMMRIGGVWYESDATWDDLEKRDVEHDGGLQYDAAWVMLEDDEFMYKVHHYLFCVDSDYIEHFTDQERYRYELDNGAWFIPMGESYHIHKTTDENYVEGSYPGTVSSGVSYSSQEDKGYVSGEVFPDSSSRYLTEKDLETLRKGELGADAMVRLALNELYARNGYTFSNSWYRNYYMQCSWYDGGNCKDSQVVEERFNDYERANKKFLREYEKSHNYAWDPAGVPCRPIRTPGK